MVFEKCQGVRVSSQRNVYTLGLLLGRVARAAEETALDPESDSFVSDVTHVLRAVFAFLRREVAERGVRDVSAVLDERGMCRKVLNMLGVVPSAAAKGPAVGTWAAGPPAPRGLSMASQAGAAADERVLRVATWNIAGGHKSGKAPDTWTDADQRAAVFQEVLRWEQIHKCDVVALQECEDAAACPEMVDKYVLAGSAAARANRGYVHLYVRKGVDFEACTMVGDKPAVAAHVKYPGGGAGGPCKSVVLVAVHLPSGDQSQLRKQCVEAAVASRGPGAGEVVVVGDMNAQDDEVRELCDKARLLEARYHGCSWGVNSNKFYIDSGYRGPGLRYDRVLFAGSLWVEAHLIGEARRFFDGAEFCLSDHFGLLSYVDVHDAYNLRSRSGQMQARARRLRLVSMKDFAVQKELVESKALLQLGREEGASSRRRAAQRDRGNFQQAQQRAAKQRAERRKRMKTEAFGEDTLFASPVVAVPSVGDGVPGAAHDVWIQDMGAVVTGDWNSSCDLPRRGLRNQGDTCFVNAAVQLLMRVPAVVAWMHAHGRHCNLGSAGCLLCALRDTRLQVMDGRQRAPPPVIAAQDVLQLLHSPPAEPLHDRRQHDVVEFLDRLFVAMCTAERAAGRCGAWAHVQSDRAVATQVERVFGFVHETRRRCTRCRNAPARCNYECERVWRMTAQQTEGAPLTISELYLASCALETDPTELVFCGQCQANTVHVKQRRILSAPNVLLMQLKRLPGQPRVPVCVEEQLNVPHLPLMDLAGVVYHHGKDTNSGHYTCLCRGTGGSFYYFDDEKEPVRENQEVGHVLPRAVYVVAYCRRGGVAEYAVRPPDVGHVVDLVADVDMEAGGDARRERGGGDWECAVGSVSAESGCGPAGGAAAVPSAAAAAAAAVAVGVAGAAPAAAVAVTASRGRARRVSQGATAGAPRIVTGFGSERIDDVRAHEARREAEALERHTHRADEGDRGRMRDAEDRDLDRGAGGPWQAGRR